MLRMSKPVPIGTRGEVQQKVAFEHTLARFTEKLPPVLSTPDMIGLMEWACYVAAEPYCEGDEITVGTAVNVEHLAATGIGSLVKAEAVLERIEGKFYIYRVRALDERQEIGRGTVTRAFVSIARFMKRIEPKPAPGAAFD
jgi:fluoroacetyl-CoA thioesterase